MRDRQRFGIVDFFESRPYDVEAAVIRTVLMETLTAVELVGSVEWDWKREPFLEAAVVSLWIDSRLISERVYVARAFESHLNGIAVCWLFGG